MKKILILAVLMTLTAFTARSQDTTDTRPVVFPFWMAKEIAFDLNELEYLRAESTVNSLQLVKYERLVQSLQEVSAKKDAQIALKSKLAENWRIQYEAEKAKKPKNNTFVWILRCVGAAAVGFVVGVVAY